MAFAIIPTPPLANMTGLVPDKRGMHEPSAGIGDLARIFALKEDGGILSQTGVMDLAKAVGRDYETMLPGHVASGNLKRPSAAAGYGL